MGHPNCAAKVLSLESLVLLKASWLFSEPEEYKLKGCISPHSPPLRLLPSPAPAWFSWSQLCEV